MKENNDSNQLKKDTTSGGCGSHGAQMKFTIQTRAPAYPIMKGMLREMVAHQS